VDQAESAGKWTTSSTAHCFIFRRMTRGSRIKVRGVDVDKETPAPLKRTAS